MKITFLINSLGVGGEQRVISILSNLLYKKGYKVTIFVLVGKNISFDIDSGIEIVFLDENKLLQKPLKNIKRMKKIRTVIKKSKADIVISFAIIPNILASLGLLFTNIPLIICERNDPDIYIKPWKILRRLSYNFAEGAVFQTNDAKKYFNSWLKIKSVIIPNPLKVNALPSKKNSVKKIIVSAGRLVEAKNQKMLIKAYSNIVKQFPDYDLIIYGEGHLRTSLEKLISDLNLEENVFLPGEKKDIYPYINEASVFVLTSNNEGFPNALAEAMAMKIPVISTNCRIGGPSDMIEDSVNGLLIEVGDEKSLKLALINILSDQKYAQELANNASNIKKRLDSNNIIKHWESFIFEIIELI